MQKTGHITHIGVVTNKVDHKTIIHLLAGASCQSCHLKGFCGSENEDRSRFEVTGQGFDIGDQVTLEITSGSGLKAVFWAYLLPFLLLVTTLIIAEGVRAPEAVSGLLALMLLIPYYFILSRFRKQLRSGLHLKVRRK